MSQRRDPNENAADAGRLMAGIVAAFFALALVPAPLSLVLAVAAVMWAGWPRR